MRTSADQTEVVQQIITLPTPTLASDFSTMTIVYAT